MSCLSADAWGADPKRNRAVLQQALDSGAGAVELPPGAWQLSGGLRLDDGRRLVGARAADVGSATTLQSTGDTDAPLLHVVGSDVSISDVHLEVPISFPGEHDGDRGTAITVGCYLYDRPPTWIENVRLERISIRRTTAAGSSVGSLANSVALMGAVRHIDLDDVTILSGGSGLAVHWGAIASSVQDVTGPSYHPHHLNVRRLQVKDAFEGFYLSSVHHVTVQDAHLENVDIGFRLLPGDNTVRFASAEDAAAVSSHLDISDCHVSWKGPLYAVRIAGWGRSEVDALVTSQRYAETVVRRCRFTALALPQGVPAPVTPRAAVVLEDATGVLLEDVAFDGMTVDLLRSNGPGATRCTVSVADAARV